MTTEKTPAPQPEALVLDEVLKRLHALELKCEELKTGVHQARLMGRTDRQVLDSIEQMLAQGLPALSKAIAATSLRPTPPGAAPTPPGK